MTTLAEGRDAAFSIWAVIKICGEESRWDEEWREIADRFERRIIHELGMTVADLEQWGRDNFQRILSEAQPRPSTRKD